MKIHQASRTEEILFSLFFYVIFYFVMALVAFFPQWWEWLEDMLSK